jgi:hypothetical protein
MQVLTAASKLDWRTWARGIIGAIISGGAGGVGGSLGAMATDPEHFNPAMGGYEHLIVLAKWAFAISALISLAKFLQTQPIPKEEEKTT